MLKHESNSTINTTINSNKLAFKPTEDSGAGSPSSEISERDRHYQYPSAFQTKSNQAYPMPYTNAYQDVSPPLTPSVSPYLIGHQFKPKYHTSSCSSSSSSSSSPPTELPSFNGCGISLQSPQESFYRRNSSGYLSHPQAPIQCQSSLEINSQSLTKDNIAMPCNPHGQHQNKHVCKHPMCGWSFKRYEHLKRHMYVHTGERPYVCRYPGCGKSFSRSDNFNSHYRTHAKKTLSRPKQSSHALNMDSQRTFNENANYMYSYPTLDERRLSYPEEPKTYLPQPNRLFQSHNSVFHVPKGRHNSPHLSPIAHQESQLPSRCTSGLQMDILLSPNKEKPAPVDRHPCRISSSKEHICPVIQCHRQFKRLEHLKRHMRIHTCERPFACSVPTCHKTFSRSDNLSQHMKTHERHAERRRQQHSTDLSTLYPKYLGNESSFGPTLDNLPHHLPPIQHSHSPERHNEMNPSLGWLSKAGSVGC
ncbi:hypothetical protein CLU79DRAFT_839121 [Phycomyces nitens]|nr:hypothetical protein CLU79DRAFT_839121 [Phycomyces nitens]